MADLVRTYHWSWQTWRQQGDSPSALASQLLCLADSVEREIKRKCYILL